MVAAFHCAKAKRLSMRARQCSKRAGDLHVVVNSENQTVDIIGDAVTTVAGTMFVP